MQPLTPLREECLALHCFAGRSPLPERGGQGLADVAWLRRAARHRLLRVYSSPLRCHQCAACRASPRGIARSGRAALEHSRQLRTQCDLAPDRREASSAAVPLQHHTRPRRWWQPAPCTPALARRSSPGAVPRFAPCCPEAGAHRKGGSGAARGRGRASTDRRRGAKGESHGVEGMRGEKEETGTREKGEERLCKSERCFSRRRRLLRPLLLPESGAHLSSQNRKQCPLPSCRRPPPP